MSRKTPEIKDARDAEREATQIATMKATSKFGIRPSSVIIDSTKLTETADIRNYLVHGHVAIITKPKGFLTREERQEHVFLIRLHASQDKLLAFEWA